jgi:phage shock protein A
MTSDSSADREVMRELSSRLNDVVARWRAQLRDSVPAARQSARDARIDKASSLATLRVQLAEIEREIARVEHVAAERKAAAGTWERRAMHAIAAGNDHAAKTALIEQSAHVEAAAAFEPDLTVLRAIAAECRLTISESS